MEQVAWSIEQKRQEFPPAFLSEFVGKILKDCEVAAVCAAASFAHEHLSSLGFWFSAALSHPATPTLFTSSPVKPASAIGSASSLRKVAGIVKSSSFDS